MKISRVSILAFVIVFLSSLLPLGGGVYADVTFSATELLGRPTDTSVTVNVVPSSSGQIYFEYGTASGVYTGQTSTDTLTSGTPYEVVISGLSPNTKYYYRMVSSSDGSTWVNGTEHSFYTQRAQGSTFTFTITADSHVNIVLGNAATWTQTMNNVADDNPDFNLDLGDTFAMDSVTTVSGAEAAYLYQRQFFDLVGHSASIFLVAGNHEQTEGWHLDDTGNPATSQPVIATNAQKKYYINPVPDSFYTGNTETYAYLSDDQLPEDYYAWEWGDALFVVIDPFWYTSTKPYVGNMGGGETSDPGSGDRWDWTLGEDQYDWLKQTLEDSSANYKFIFAHHMVGGSDDYVRGGANPAHIVEWGGYNENGITWGWDSQRSGWSSDPIHQIFVDNNVSAFFHGHDHQYAYEMRDGVVYQCLPAAGFSGNGFNIYSTGSGYTIQALPSPGHLRVTVSPSQASVDYVGTSSGTVNYSYTILPDPVNQAPEVSDIPGETIAEGASFATINLDEYVSDPDNTDAEMTWTYSGDIDLTVSIDGSRVATIGIPDADWNGAETITFRATDPGALWDEDSATFTVTAVNDPPNQPTLVAPPDGSVDISTSPTLEVNVTDPDSDPLDVTFYGREDRNFAIIALPDTQLYSQSYPSIYNAQTQWIVDNHDASNIVYVAHEGDIVNTASSTTQWDNADDAMSLLENPATTGLPDGIPYGMLPGNHDIPTTNYNTYFGISRFAGRSYYSGYYGSNNDNNYSLFSAAGMDFIVINLEFEPDTSILSWADGLLKTYNDHRAIVVTHYILNTDDSWGYQAVFTELKDNPNLFLMLCGHMHDGADGEARRTETGDFGNTIYILLADYQDYANGGNGYLRILEFSPIDDEISVKTYSPWLDSYETDADSQFVLVYDMEDYITLGTVSGVVSGGNAPFPWSVLAAETTHEWYVEVTDGSETITSSIWSFTTNDPASSDPPEVSDIPDQTIAEGETLATINLDDYVEDPDNTDAEMTWTYSGNTELTVSIVSRVATIGVPYAEWNGAETITFRATDPGALWDEDSATFTVSAAASVISGITAEVNGVVIPGATVKLYLDGVLQSTTTSGPDGQYELIATETGDYTVAASAAGFKNETQAISITSLGDGYTLDFIGNSGLIPQAPDLSYVLTCANHWLYPPVGHPELTLSMSKVLAVANAWLYH